MPFHSANLVAVIVIATERFEQRQSQSLADGLPNLGTVSVDGANRRLEIRNIVTMAHTAP